MLKYFSERAKKLSLLDIKLAVGAAMCIALIAAKLFPQILGNIRVRYLAIVCLLLYIKPFYSFFIKK